MKLTQLKQTASFCPSQWEAITQGSHYPIYIRYRHGRLTVQIGKLGKRIGSAVRGAVIHESRHGDEYDGVISWDQVKPIIDALPHPKRVKR